MLDLDRDGFLSRGELTEAAVRFGWSWREAPLLAVLDRLSIANPISKGRFIALVDQIRNDPLGPYGDVLRRSPAGHPPAAPEGGPNVKSDGPALMSRQITPDRGHKCRSGSGRLAGFLAQHTGIESAEAFQALRDRLDAPHLSARGTCVLIIDPQRAFTRGAWMRSIGPDGQADVTPIRLAFGNCAAFLRQHYGRMEIMFTRCPFPAGSYGWDDRLSGVIAENQPYFIKPGNSVLFPPANGFREWIGRCIDRGRNVLVLGGCTVNSCIRVSSMEIRKAFGEKLKIVADLSMCGARGANYAATSQFSGKSPVEAAVNQMANGGITVVRRVEWA